MRESPGQAQKEHEAKPTEVPQASARRGGVGGEGLLSLPCDDVKADNVSLVYDIYPHVLSSA